MQPCKKILTDVYIEEKMSTFLVLISIFTNWKTCSGVFLIGTRLPEGQFPWLIQFKTIAPCGGVLVSPDWVLTAAQCVQTDRQSISLQAVGLNGTGPLQVIRVLHAYIHPDYKVQFHDHDHNIALIKLAKPFDLCDSKVRFMDIAPITLDDKYKSCLIFGWQSYVGPSSKVFAKPIQYSQVVLDAWKYCINMHKGNASLSNVFCTMVEAEGEMMACSGNPGTPVVCEDQHQRMVLLGIASWSKFSLDCGGLPSYLSVIRFRSWIYKLIIRVKELEDRQKSQIRSSDCKNKAQGGIYVDQFQNNTQLLESNKSHHPNDVSELLEKARKFNLMLELESYFSEQDADQSIISPTPINETIDNVDDYAMLLNNKDESFVGNTKEREKNPHQFQETGPNRDVAETVASSSEASELSYGKKPSLTGIKGEEHTDESENLDDLEVIFPFPFEKYRSNAFVNPLLSKLILIFNLSFLYILCK